MSWFKKEENSGPLPPGVSAAGGPSLNAHKEAPARDISPQIMAMAENFNTMAEGISRSVRHKH